MNDLPWRAPVLVYRTNSKRLEVPFRFITMENETIILKISRGRRIFRIICFRPWKKWMLGKDKKLNQSLSRKLQQQNSINYHHRNRDKYRSRWHSPEGSNKEVIHRKKSIRKVEKYRNRRAHAHGSKLKPRTRVFGFRFIDELKKVDEQLEKKSCLV